MRLVVSDIKPLRAGEDGVFMVDALADGFHRWPAPGRSAYCALYDLPYPSAQNRRTGERGA